MTNQERYRAAFAVKVPEQAVQCALEQVESGVRPRRRRRVPRMLLAAALVGSLLITTVGAELNNGAITNFLAPAFGSTRTELLETVGRPVGATVSADGYTVTVEAVAGDQHLLVVVYSILREDGQPFPEGAGFYQNGTNLLNGGGGSFGHSELDPENPSRALLYEYYSLNRRVPRTITICLYQLFQEWDENYEPIVLANGPWELSFTRRYPDTTREISAKGTTFTDYTSNEYTISYLTISAFGVYVSFSSSGTPLHPEGSVTLKDGSTVKLGDYGLGSSGSKSVLRFSYKNETGDQKIMISPDDIVSITLCDTTISID